MNKTNPKLLQLDKI